MNPLFHAPLRAAAVGAASAVIGVLATLPASAAGDGSAAGVHVVNTETVQVYTSPSGEIQTRRVYEQLALTGHGSVDLSNPVSTANLRNLDGFGGFTVEHGNQITRTTVDGDKQLRSVSDYNGKLPLDVSVAYKLNGRNVKPGDVVGKDGHLEVTYTVQNVTAEPERVSFDDGHGGTVVKTVQVPIPMVGSLTTTAPSSFTNVQSASANMGGDGKGGTQLSFTMTLFPPIGSDTAVFGYSADVKDGVVPRAEVSALPVNPMESPTFKSAAGSYKGGADTGAQLADGAGQIDSNLLKLRDGAAQLLAGLIKLRDGAGRLETGLAGQAVPGSQKVADGAGALDTGLGRISSGSKRLAAGTGEAFAGSKKLDAGANKLARGLKAAQVKAPALITGMGDLRAGLVAVNDGLTQMYQEVGGIPAQAQPLFDGIKQMLDGIGTTSQPDTLLYGVDQVRAGLTAALPQIQQMADGVYSNSPTAPGAYQKLGCAATVLDVVTAGTQPVAASSSYVAGSPNRCFVSATNPTGAMPPLAPLASVDPSDGLSPDEYRTLTISSVINGIKGGLPALATPNGAVDQSTLYGGLLTLKQQLQHFPDPTSATPGAIVALAAIECGLDNTSVDSLTLPNGVPASAVCKRYTSGPDAGQKMPGLAQGLNQLDGGINQLIVGVIDAVRGGIGEKTDTPEDQTLRGGMNGLIGGVDLLSAGGGDLVDGLGLLSAGGTKVANGAGDLSDGLGRLDAGAITLSGGVRDAKDGSRRLADGADQLSSGLKDAANGSSRLSAGLREAAKGAPGLVKGSQRLSDEGTKQLVTAGEDTARSYGELYATMTAGAQRAGSESMAFGAPKGAIGLTAYNYVIEGDDGEGGRNWARGVGGLAILGAGAGAFALRRRIA